ncbi:histidine phosphatase family protein [Sneathiella limimaris]|uniref:histidine phosphatase family protein n=1 Tax=Sneathiella limimaris TaxID=1964213 RepID=UPI00146B7F31
MVEIWIVRHGEASSSWDQEADPGLSILGQEQAEAVTQEILKTFKPAKIVSSPLKRALETAAPLFEKLDARREINSNIAEIPSGDIPFAERRAWLNKLMKETWETQPENLQVWREGILSTLKSQTEDVVFFSHFMVLNVIVGFLTGSEKIVSFKPDNCAITKVSLADGELDLIDKGREAQTIVR